MLAISLVLFFAIVLVIFSKELGGVFKKFFAIRGVPLFVPLIMGSLFVVIGEPWIVKSLITVKWVFDTVIYYLASYLPFMLGARELISLLILLLLTSLPLYGVMLWNKRRSYSQIHYGVFLTTIIWLLAVIILIIPMSLMIPPG